MLFIGWRRDMDSLIGVLDKWVPPGSEVKRGRGTALPKERPRLGRLSRPLAARSSPSPLAARLCGAGAMLCGQVWVFCELSVDERLTRLVEEDFEENKLVNLALKHSVGDPKVRIRG